MISVSFFVNKAKRDKQGMVPINAKIYRSEDDKSMLYTKVRVKECDWDGYKVLETEPQHKVYNTLLGKIKSDILLQYMNHMEESASSIKEYYLNTFKVKYTIGDLFREYMEMRLADPAMKNKDTRRTYVTHQRAVTNYLKATQLYSYDANIFAFQQGRILYQKILNDAKSVIYSNKLMRKLRAALDWGIGERKTDTNMLTGFELKSLPKKRLSSTDFLTVEEIARLISAEAPPRYDTAKVLATRQLFTGMAYADAISFTPDKVSTFEDKKVLIGKRIKTDEEYIVPLDMVAQAVCNAHSWKTKKLSNCTYNEHLKVLAAFAGIKKNVTTHMLRRSFAQNTLNSGVSEEVVAKMMGHVDTRMLRFYATVSQFRVLNEYNDRMAA
jgi:site-specific recombinase XerD